jgi:hypothetical protein
MKTSTQIAWSLKCIRKARNKAFSQLLQIPQLILANHRGKKKKIWREIWPKTIWLGSCHYLSHFTSKTGSIRYKSTSVMSTKTLLHWWIQIGNLLLFWVTTSLSHPMKTARFYFLLPNKSSEKVFRTIVLFRSSTFPSSLFPGSGIKDRHIKPNPSPITYQTIKASIVTRLIRN